MAALSFVVLMPGCVPVRELNCGRDSEERARSYLAEQGLMEGKDYWAGPQRLGGISAPREEEQRLGTGDSALESMHPC